MGSNVHDPLAREAIVAINNFFRDGRDWVLSIDVLHRLHNMGSPWINWTGRGDPITGENLDKLLAPYSLKRVMIKCNIDPTLHQLGYKLIETKASIMIYNDHCDDQDGEEK